MNNSFLDISKPQMKSNDQLTAREEKEKLEKEFQDFESSYISGQNKNI